MADTLIDGNTYFIGLLIDNIMDFISAIFGGLATFGTTLGIIIGVTFVMVMILVFLGKINISNMMPKL